MFGNRVSKDIDDIKVFEKMTHKYIYSKGNVIFDNRKSKITIHASLNNRFMRGYHDRIRS
ncbi:MAG: hypothetical protein A4E24_01977 [Methanomethylovorans sp. PtaU1.Bin093]|nr:MAG: hypothetical protein A4E24_01977 [Methanomethylovorans sp. PtaU1.Bin093]